MGLLLLNDAMRQRPLTIADYLNDRQCKKIDWLQSNQINHGAKYYLQS